jgi:hypothetical protein
MKRDRKRAIFSSAPELCDTSCLLAATPSLAGNKVGFAAEASGRDPRWSSPKSSRNRAFSARSTRSSASASSSRARPSLSCERPVTLALFPLYGGVPTAPRLRRGDPGVWYAPGLCRSGSRDGCSTQESRKHLGQGSGNVQKVLEGPADDIASRGVLRVGPGLQRITQFGVKSNGHDICWPRSHGRPATPARLQRLDVVGR